MEDDEEVLSHPSEGTGSPVSPPLPPPRPNGRITVTVAAVPPSQNTLTLALPIQQQQQGRAGGSGGGGGREDCWSEGATGVLIDAWGERYLELSRGNLKQKHWKDVADIVSSREDYTKTPKTDIQCKNRIDTVKKKYKLEKTKIAAAGGLSKWPFFERLDQLIGTSAKINSSMASGHVPRVVPMGIPMGGVRSAPQLRQQPQQQLLQKQKQQFRKLPPPPVVDSDDEEESEPEPEEASPDSADDFPPETYESKRPRIQREVMNLGEGGRPGLGTNRERRDDGGVGEKGRNIVGEKKWGSSVRELTRAILRFGEVYEQAESAKLQQLVDMEKHRMKFAKELELQRMQFFMKTQLELSQLKTTTTSSSRRFGNYNNNNNNNNHHQSSNNINTINNNNHHSDSSN